MTETHPVGQNPPGHSFWYPTPLRSHVHVRYDASPRRTAVKYSRSGIRTPVAALDAVVPSMHTGTPIAALLAATFGVGVFHHATRYGFSQDDWMGLARATGLATSLPFGWRWLSHQAFWDLAAGPLSQDAARAHAVVLAAHAFAVVLLVVLLARRVGAPAALIGGTFFATHFAQFTANFWLSANGDVIATLLAIATALAFARRDFTRWLAVPLFACALLTKESVLGLPIALAAISALIPNDTPRPSWWRDRLLWTLSALSLAWLALLRPGSSGAALGDAAYAIDARAILPNLLTYAAWTLNAWFPTVRDVSDRVAPEQYGWAFSLLALWLAACCVPGLRRRGVLAALGAYLALLLPVLMLGAHTYHYYLVIALPAAAGLIAALADFGFSRTPRVAAWSVAVTVAALLACNGALLSDRIENTPFKAPGLRADAIVDRALIATNAVDGLRPANLPDNANLAIWSPQSQAMSANEGVPAQREGYYESNLRAALLDGLALRVALPQVGQAHFVRAFDPADSLTWWVVMRYDGHLRATPPGELARVLARAEP